MPIPIHANQARLIIDGVTYELRDVHAHEAETISRERVTADGGRTIGFTRGRVSTRITIEAEVLPTRTNIVSEDRVAEIFGVRRREPDQAGLTETDQLLIGTAFQQLMLAEATERVIAKRTALEAEPKSALDRLLDDSCELC